MKIEKHLNLLGHRVKDKVTGFSGIVTSVTFDLYGCIQGLVHPGLDTVGKFVEQVWFDFNRLEILDGTPVMPNPFSIDPTDFALKGPAEKPKASNI